MLRKTRNKRNTRHKTRRRKTRKQMRNKRRISRRYSRHRVMEVGWGNKEYYVTLYRTEPGTNRFTLFNNTVNEEDTISYTQLNGTELQKKFIKDLYVNGDIPVEELKHNYISTPRSSNVSLKVVKIEQS